MFLFFILSTTFINTPTGTALEFRDNSLFFFLVVGREICKRRGQYFKPKSTQRCEHIRIKALQMNI